MPTVESHGQTKEVYSVQLWPEYGSTVGVTSFYKADMEDFSGRSLLSSVALTPEQVALGKKIAEKHGLTE